MKIIFDETYDVLDLTPSVLEAEAVGEEESEGAEEAGNTAAPVMLARPQLEQSMVGPPESFPDQSEVVPAIVDPAQATAGDIEQAGCVGCGSNHGLINSYHASVPPSGPHFPHAGCSSCGVGLGTCAGIPPCYPCDAKTVFGRFFHGVYQCICCPDPCYDPHWIPIADAAFFTEAPRPVTQTRFRWDTGLDVIFPDRSEYFWAKADGTGLGPTPKLPFRGPKKVDYMELSVYSETASDLFSFFINTPYRVIESATVTPGRAAGFGDID
ncbi:MAG: hypothetical protein AB7K24_18270, partial [Gemmataceae bacterium]